MSTHSKTRVRLRLLYRRSRWFILHHVLHSDDSPHRLALGVAIGLFVGFTPFQGLQMILVVILAWLLGANKIVGLPLVWISNPATIVPLYFPCYWIGAKLMGNDPWAIPWQNIDATTADGWLSEMRYFWHIFADIAGPLMLGCAIVGFVFAVAGYALSLYMIRAYRMKRFGQYQVPPAYLKKR